MHLDMVKAEDPGRIEVNVGCLSSAINTNRKTLESRRRNALWGTSKTTTLLPRAEDLALRLAIIGPGGHSQYS